MSSPGTLHKSFLIVLVAGLVTWFVWRFYPGSLALHPYQGPISACESNVLAASVDGIFLSNESFAMEDVLSSKTLMGLCTNMTNNLALPFYWFCSTANANVVRVEGPAGTVNLEFVGRLHSFGQNVYIFSAQVAGIYSIVVEDVVVANARLQRDECSCPMSREAFVKTYKCHPDDEARVTDFFEPWFPKSLSWETFSADMGSPSGTGGDWVVHFAVISNELYWKTFRSGPIPDLEEVIVLFLSLLRKVQVPDVEFFYSPHYSPIRPLSSIGPPVLSFTTTSANCDVLIPAPHMLRSFYGDHLRDACQGGPWGSRMPQGYFRGTNIGWMTIKRAEDLLMHPRFRVAYISKARQDLLDAKVHIGYQDLPAEAVTRASNLALTLPELPPPVEALKYKWLIDIDGNTSSRHTAQHLRSGSLMLKQESRFKEFFHDLLVPNLHHLPLEIGLSDLVEKLEWAKTHDDEAKKMAERAMYLTLTRLRVEDMLCWVALVFEQISRTLDFTPQVREGMVKANYTDQSSCDCSVI